MNQGTFDGRALARTIGPAFLLFSLVLPVAARDLPNYDSLAASPVMMRPERITAAAAPRTSAQPEAIQVHSRLGVPTFLWGAQVPAAGRVKTIAGITTSTPATSAARSYLGGLGDLYLLSPSQAAAATVANTQVMPNGSTLVKFRNQIDGIEVFREEASVMLNGEKSLVAIGGFLMDKKSYAPYAISSSDAVARALRDWSFGSQTAAQMQFVESRDGYEFLALPASVKGSDGSSLIEPARLKRVLFRLPYQLVPAYYVEIQVRDGAAQAATDGAIVGNPHGHGSTGTDYYAYVVSAVDASLLWRGNLTHDAAYKVYAEPSGNYLPLPGPTGRNGFPHPNAAPNGYIAPLVGQNTITLENLPFSRNDPWLPPGAITTKGNNVEAFVDLYAPDNITPTDPSECNTAGPPVAGDFHACGFARGGFNHTFDPNRPPTVDKIQVMATITNLFYMNNWLHDWYYDAGFDEASGNAQTSNFGRGGLGNDSIFAEAQDFSGIFNANMSTPADGARPRMRMYLFPQDSLRVVNAPAAIAGVQFTGNAQYGPQEFDLTSNVAYASPANGCSAISGVAGKIAFIDRGVCTFVAKVLNAQAAGAIGVIIANNTGGTQLVYSLGIVPQITIPTVTVAQIDGNAIRAQLLLPATVNIRIANHTWRDGTLDNAVIAHEWGHYISNRLVGNGGGLNSNQAGGMGEGFGDFHAMLLLVKDGDRLLPTNANFNGTYALAIYALGAPFLSPLPAGQNEAAYYGIRRYPYSRDTSKNPLTFQHIADGVPLPFNPPPAFGQDGSSNSEVHNTGEVWTTMLWECYSNLLNDSGRLTFAEAQERMKRYLVAGYKMAPIDPTFTEMRDSILAAIGAQDGQDYALCYQGFAKRGAGFGAVAPDRYSFDNSGVVESFLTGGGLAIDSVTMADARLRCTDQDGYMDNGELGSLVVRIRNAGTTTLSSTSLSLSRNNSHLTFPLGTSYSVPTTQPGQSIDFAVPVRVGGASGIEYVDVTASINDPGLVIPGPVVSGDSFRLNAQNVANASATDDVESTHTAWTPMSQAAPGAGWTWRRVQIAGNDHRWLGPDGGTPQLTWLQSPPLVVAPTGSFSFTFKHRHWFEFDGGGNYDGGQIHISTNNGASWTNIGASAAPGYNGTLVVYGGNGNPLQGQAAYVQTNASYPSQDTVTVSLGTAYAGMTVLVRFAIGTDNAAGAPGWEVDDIAFTNITNKPFDIVVPQIVPAACN